MARCGPRHDCTQRQMEKIMNRGSVLSISVMATLGLAALPSSAISQQRTLKNQLIGTWTLASWEHVLPNGNKVQSYGTNPKGIVVFDANGRLFLMFARADLPKIASNAPATATPEEAKALVDGSIAYFGTYTVDDADRVISLHLEASTFANQLGSDQKGTIISVTDDELRYEMIGWPRASSIAPNAPP
jgi:Lipocalin-like domain